MGTLRNGFYLAAGTTYNSATDQLFGFSENFHSLNPGSYTTDSVGERLVGVNVGAYHGLLRLNINANVPETNYSNNDSTASGMLYVDADALTLGVADSNTLDLEKPVYYKVNVSAGEDMLITLNSTITDPGINEVYVAHGRVPKPNDFDHQHQLQPGLNQEVLISNTKAGTYYIMASTQSRFTQVPSTGGGVGGTGVIYTGTQRITKFQDITLKAEVLPFSILRIAPGSVGQGLVTTAIEGAGFRDSAIVSLEDGAGVTVASASISNFINSTKVEVLWDLTSVATGTYDVVFTNPDNSSTRLNNGLEVQSSTGFLTNMHVNAPPMLRTGKSGFYTFYIENSGNVDIPYVRAEISVRDYTAPTSHSANSPKIFLPSDMNKPAFQVSDWRTYGPVKVLPFVVRDLKPGERVSVDVTFRNFLYARFPYRMKSVASDVPTFVEGTAQMMELLRQAVLRDEDSISDQQVFNMLYDREAFRDTMFTFLIDQGVLEADDTVGVNTACKTCNNGYDFSPGASPGVGKYGKLKLKAGQNMLWEINHPEGSAGGELGWDIVEARDSIIIQATSSNPFQIDLLTLSSWSNQPDFLTTWSPGYDHCWPVMVASGGISGFNANKFTIDHSQFSDNTPLHGGNFALELSQAGDTLYLCYKAATPGVGVQGFPGGDGHYGQDGGRGGPGGPCDANNAPGAGGPGGKGGPGVGGYLAPGQGGKGGPGGDCTGGNFQGGIGGVGGQGGLAGDGQNAGSGGDGGDGGYPGGDGGDGGDGGPSDEDGGPGPGGKPGDGDDDNGPDGPGDDGDDGDDGPDTDDPENPNNPNNPDYPPKRPDIPPTGPPGGPKRPTGPGNPPSSPPGSPPAGCGGGSGSNPFDRCDEWKDLNGKLGCSATAYGCGKDIVIGTAAAGGAGAAVAVGGCLLGTFNCVTGGNVYTNCAEAVYNTLTGSAVGATAAGSSCLENLLCDDTPVTSSCDPNEIEGPEGFSSDRLVAADAEMGYTIYFENDSALATTAAQRVVVRQEIDPNMDPLSLQLTEFGFADTSFQIPNTPPNYTTTLDLTSTFGVDVEFTAGVDVVNNELFWIFQSIDKSTGASPYDPLAGFLAVNDSLGSGEGYVKYKINPASGVATGDSVTAQAEIVFDVNSSIITNTWYNIIDAVAPNTTMDSILPNQDSISFETCWSGQDDIGGSGLGMVNIYYSENGGAYQLAAQVPASDSCYTFTGNNLSTYDFFLLVWIM
ncbi:MAG: hypothetical protein U5L96_21455 [Owenweeksia sp.]|nr:hypothetical protein [Owenweeksia sp.]